MCVEVTWWDLSTDRRGQFIPPHDVSETLAGADLAALRINGYIDRIAGQLQDEYGKEARALSSVLTGQTLAGANPSFDAEFLTKMYDTYERGDLAPFPEWHYRLWDLSAYAAGALALDYLPGLTEVCELLGTDARPDHSAAGDVTATGQCFLEWFKRAGVKPPQ